MPVINTSELMARLCALEVEAMNALDTPISSNAVPRWLYSQEQMPYWRNRITSAQLITTPNDDGEEMEMYQYSITAALNYAHYGSGYNGERDEEIFRLIPQVIEYFDAREVLQSNAFPDGMNFLQKAWFMSVSAYDQQGLSAGGGTVIGPTFQFTCIFSKYLAQAYL